MQTICESDNDVLKACAEVRKLWSHTSTDEASKVYTPLSKYARAHKDTLSPQARDAYNNLRYWMVNGKDYTPATAQ